MTLLQYRAEIVLILLQTAIELITVVYTKARRYVRSVIFVRKDMFGLEAGTAIGSVEVNIIWNPWWNKKRNLIMISRNIGFIQPGVKNVKEIVIIVRPRINVPSAHLMTTCFSLVVHQFRPPSRSTSGRQPRTKSPMSLVNWSPPRLTKSRMALRPTPMTGSSVTSQPAHLGRTTAGSPTTL